MELSLEDPLSSDSITLQREQSHGRYFLRKFQARNFLISKKSELQLKSLLIKFVGKQRISLTSPLYSTFFLQPAQTWHWLTCQVSPRLLLLARTKTLSKSLVQWRTDMWATHAQLFFAWSLPMQIWQLPMVCRWPGTWIQRESGQLVWSQRLTLWTEERMQREWSWTKM